MKKILIKGHALKRLIERSDKFNLDYPEALERVFKTIKRRGVSRKHTSKKHKTYNHYFKDNLTF